MLISLAINSPRSKERLRSPSWTGRPQRAGKLLFEHGAESVRVHEHWYRDDGKDQKGYNADKDFHPEL